MAAVEGAPPPTPRAAAPAPPSDRPAPHSDALAPPSDGTALPTSLAQEQALAAVLYARLDLLRQEASLRLQRTRSARAGGNPQMRSERDAFDALWSTRLTQLLAVDEGLCFGALELLAEPPLHLGRIGLLDDEQRTLLVDWRAPAAEPFYRATGAEPMGARRRRHLRTTGRAVTGYDDEWLDLDAVDAEELGAGSGLTGEAALVAALSAQRTGQMRDVVATLQAEQDRIVRAPREGVLVVQGGPGTGKTAVALHRAAYLLYTHRERLATSGVLVVGPNPVFLRYVEQVLPSLGETAVVLATVGDLVPGVRARAGESPAAMTIKGDPRMVGLLGRGVRDRQRAPRGDTVLAHDGHRLRLDRRTVDGARRRAQDSRRLHNPARNTFVRAVLSALARQILGRDAWASTEGRDRDAVLLDLIRNPEVRRAVSDWWPHLTPQRFLEEWYADPQAMHRSGLTFEEAAVLGRPAGSPWTSADVPLLDEVAELLGPTDPWGTRSDRSADAARRRDVRDAERALADFGAAGFVSADALAARYAGDVGVGTVAERAAEDRLWAYGHVVVDEAQELSPMAWRTVLRRCPSRSMTVVGDTAQASSPWSIRRWSEAMDTIVPADRWRIEELTVGYRTPAEVMALAAPVLAAIDPTLTAPRAVRSAGFPPRLVQPVSGAGLAETAAVTVAQELAAAAGGRVAVLTAPAALTAVTEALGAAGLRASANDLEAPLVVLPAAASKGLEFDAVVVVDPAGIIAAAPRGRSDLYVALTRTTLRLAVVAAREQLPPELRQGLAEPPHEPAG